MSIFITEKGEFARIIHFRNVISIKKYRRLYYDNNKKRPKEDSIIGAIGNSTKVIHIDVVVNLQPVVIKTQHKLYPPCLRLITKY